MVDSVRLLTEDENDVATWRSSRNDFGVVPEPASPALLGLGLIGLGRAARTRRPGAPPS